MTPRKNQHACVGFLLLECHGTKKRVHLGLYSLDNETTDNYRGSYRVSVTYFCPFLNLHPKHKTEFNFCIKRMVILSKFYYNNFIFISKRLHFCK